MVTLRQNVMKYTELWEQTFPYSKKDYISTIASAELLGRFHTDTLVSSVI